MPTLRTAVNTSYTFRPMASSRPAMMSDMSTSTNPGNFASADATTTADASSKAHVLSTARVKSVRPSAKIGAQRVVASASVKAPRGPRMSNNVSAGAADLLSSAMMNTGGKYSEEPGQGSWTAHGRLKL